MLVEQAAEAFLFWRGVRPRTAAGARARCAQRLAARMIAVARRARSAASLAAAAVVAFVALQLCFLLRIALMAVVDPQSTTFQRSEAWRLLLDRAADGLAAAVARLRRDLGQPQARGDRLRGRRLHRAQRRRVGRAREGLGEERSAPRASPSGPTSASPRQRGARARRRRRRAPTRAAKVVGGSTITQQLAKNLFLGGERNLAAQGPGARARLGARGDARQAAHPRDLSQQRRVGRRRVRRRGGGAALLPRRRRSRSARSRRRSWR